jgi:hypothetical protein
MTSKEQRDIIEEFMEVFPRAYTVEDTMRLCLRLKEECEILQAELEEFQRQYKALKYGGGNV